MTRAAGALAIAVIGLAGWLATPAAVAETTQSCNLYAAAGGSDANPGTQSAPYLTLRRLVTSLAAGQTGCLASGQTFDSSGNLFIAPGETHGREGAPVTITSTNPAEPATITHGLALENGTNYLAFTHLAFDWAMPKPWACWNAEGNMVPGKVLSGPGACTSGTPYHETVVQIALGGRGNRFAQDSITSHDTNICINLGGPGSEGNVIENDRIHECGPPVEAAGTGFPVVNEEWGWHSHGVYDYGHGTVIRNNYIYDNSRDGVLLYGGGSGAVVEHNIIDHNGAGVWFGDNSNNLVAWNIITNSRSPRGMADYGIGSYQPGPGNVARNNCLFGNASGEIGSGGFTSTENRTNTNPLYLDPEHHAYGLQAKSPCLGYGPQSAQPAAGEPPSEPPASEPPAPTPPPAPV